MTNSYPIIHSLSTLGVIYHFNSNYLFHPLRTDFSGEGGSGKTMIADMIQLILVGPGVYKSSTEADKDRPLDGIILKPKNNQYGAGYIVLNIEVAPKKFISIGAFIEKSSKQARMFIIQAGFDWEKTLTPLSKPVFYDQLLINGKILPVEELQHQLQDVHIKPLALKQYHQLLFSNNILPIDLSESKKTLESYASIFRSFSRGSGFKKDSHSLKIFLFGEEQKSFIEKYQAEVKSISDDYYEHDRYKKEISLINQKQGFIKEIVVLEEEYKRLKKEYFTEKANYWSEQLAQIKTELKASRESFEKAHLEELHISLKEATLGLSEATEYFGKYNISKEALRSIESKKNIIKEEIDNAYAALLTLEEKKKKVEKVENLLKENGNNLEEIKQKYADEILYKKNREVLESFEQYLGAQKILEIFNNSEWLKNFSKTNSEYEEKIRQKESKLEELKSLLNFSDLQNPNSLASWAIKYFNEPLTREQESVLIYFQKYPKVREKMERYVFSPEELFLNLDIKDSSNGGFWLNLDGIYEFIQFVPNQYLDIDVSKRTELEKRLALLSKDVKTECEELENEIEKETKIRKILFDFSGLERAVGLYLNRDSFVRIPNTEYSDLNQSEFEELLKVYSTKGQIEKEYTAAKARHEKALRSKGDIDPNNFDQQLKDAEKYFKDRNIEADKVNSYLIHERERCNVFKNKLDQFIEETNLPSALIKDIEKKLFADADSLPLVIQLKSSHYPEYVKLKGDFDYKSNSVARIKDYYDQALNDYQIGLHKKYEAVSQDRCKTENPDEGTNSLKSLYDTSKLSFEVKYNIITEQLEEGEHLKNTFHVGQLAHKLLPTVFASSVLENEDQLNEKLTERLQKLYQTIREIGSRKIEILKRVFTEVDKTYRAYLDKVSKIDGYFKKPNKVITGGNKASLRYKLSSDYPAKWMTVFGKILDDQVNNVGLFEQLSEEIDINEMMKTAFISQGGTKEAEIEDLLDPKSYFDLAFELKMESGDLNSGSNSQTYSGNALLGLARLSLIGEETLPGIRIMPIDEAQGLGSNYEMLRSIAIEEKYQLLTMSIETAGDIIEGEQYIYILSENKLLDENNYVPAMGIFSDNDITPNINEFVNEENNKAKG